MPKWHIIKRMTPRNLSVLRPWFSMTKDISRFFTDPREVQLFQRYATYNGSDPYQVPATLNIIPHVEYDLGAFAALPSIHAIPRTMEKAAKNRGVKFYYGHTVETIHYDRRSIRGITAAGETVPYDAVVSNADVIYTYENLLQGFNSKYYRRYKKLEPSTSGVVFYWGINRSFPELGLHNIFFSRDYRKEFHQLFREKNLPDDPTVYINITSKLQNGDAPEGRENWFVLINVPAGREDFSGEEIGTLRSKVIRKIVEGLGISPAEIKQSICCEDTLTPRQIGERTKTSRGSLYGIASNNPFAAFLRHPNRSRDIRGLYFCGGSAHPGGGMPLSVLSGKITAELVNSGAEK
jgi:phytoene desaturase